MNLEKSNCPSYNETKFSGGIQCHGIDNDNTENNENINSDHNEDLCSESDATERDRIRKGKQPINESGKTDGGVNDGVLILMFQVKKK